MQDKALSRCSLEGMVLVSDFLYSLSEPSGVLGVIFLLLLIWVLALFIVYSLHPLTAKAELSGKKRRGEIEAIKRHNTTQTMLNINPDNFGANGLDTAYGSAVPELEPMPGQNVVVQAESPDAESIRDYLGVNEYPETQVELEGDEPVINNRYSSSADTAQIPPVELNGQPEQQIPLPPEPVTAPVEDTQPVPGLGGESQEPPLVTPDLPPVTNIDGQTELDTEEQPAGDYGETQVDDSVDTKNETEADLSEVNNTGSVTQVGGFGGFDPVASYAGTLTDDTIREIVERMS